MMKNRILIVEDDEISAKIAAYHFKNEGYEVFLIGDGAVALQMLTMNHDNYECVYLDIGIPTMSGLDVCIAVRKYEAEHPELKPLPIIAVTANYSDEDAKRYISAGMHDVIFKPLTTEKVKRFLEICKL